MLVEDTAAFIEQLEVLKDRKRADKHRRRVAQAELEMLEAMREVRLAADALQQMELALAREVESLPLRTVDELFRRPGARSLVREIGRVEAHLEAKRGSDCEAEALGRVEKSARESDATRRRATVFRLHSGQHHLDFSAARFERLLAAQLELPVLLARKPGQRWWWYLDRFWWVDTGLTATDVERMVLQADLDRKRRSDAIAEARLILLGDTRVSLVQEDRVSDAVRLAVWRRDRGRCVDCGSSESVIFDHIVPISAGGSDTALNVELRCHSCRVRLARNEMRTRVNRARAEVSPHYRDERVSA